MARKEPEPRPNVRRGHGELPPGDDFLIGTHHVVPVVAMPDTQAVAGELEGVDSGQDVFLPNSVDVLEAQAENAQALQKEKVEPSLRRGQCASFGSSVILRKQLKHGVPGDPEASPAGAEKQALPWLLYSHEVLKR